VRDIDVFFSGTLFSSYQPDKAEIVHELLRIPNLRVLMLDGHISHEEYYELLARSKITQNFCRHPGAMLTRALESLSLGSIALVQKGSVHQLWGGADAGIFTFTPGRLAEAVDRILQNYHVHAAACRAHADAIRARFCACDDCIAVISLCDRDRQRHTGCVMPQPVRRWRRAEAHLPGWTATDFRRSGSPV
jgi:hypothetical protein